MKKILFALMIAVASFTFLISCSDNEILVDVSCSDGIQNGDETGVDCGGSSCQPCAISTLEGDITDDVILDASIAYELTGAYVVNPTILTLWAMRTISYGREISLL